MRRPQDDFDAEVQAHIELEAARLEEQGIGREDALAAARRAFGNSTAARERFHESRRGLWLEHFAQDLRLAIRLLAKTPGWTTVAALTIALGIGSSVAIFSIVYAVLLRPLPFAQPDQLYWISETLGTPPMEMSIAGDYFSLRDHVARNPAQGLAGVGAWERSTVNWAAPDRARQLEAGLATWSFFTTMGVQPLHGRTFLPQEDVPGSDDAVILSYALWQREFGGSPSVIGQTMQLDRKPKRIVGVMPRDFNLPRTAELWVPFAIDEAEQRSRASILRGVFIVGRAAPGVSAERVAAQLAGFVPILKAEYSGPSSGEFTKSMALAADPLQDRMVRNVRPSLLIFTGAVGLMLFIVCFNVANLMLARATVRRREIAVRAALGAPRRRIVAQLVTESLTLAALGGAAGLLIAAIALELLSSSRQFEIARLPQVSLDATAAWFALGLTFLTGLIFGLAPAFGSASFSNREASMRDALQQESRSATGSKALRCTRQILVAAQLGLSLTLLIGAGLLAKTFWGLSNIDPGFPADGLLTARISLGGANYETLAGRVEFFQRVTAEAAGMPGVRAASVSNSIPPGVGGNAGKLTVIGQPPPPRGQEPRAAWVVAGDSYLPALGVPVLAGRLLNPSDRAGSPPVAVINAALRRQFFNGLDPIGRRINFAGYEQLEIVGVIGDVRQFGFEQEVAPQVYTSMHQLTSPTMLRSMTLVVRAERDAAAIASSVIEAAARIDADQPVFDIQTMDQRLSASLGSRRFNAALLGTFAVMAVFLAGVGVYGVMSYLAGLRLHEMGIRLALGARPREILGLIMKEGVALGLAGSALGLAGAFGLSRYLSTLLFGVSPRDAQVFAVLTAAMLLIVLAACYVPGRRAARTDPSIALRHD